MFANRYIQAVIAHDIATDIPQIAAETLDQSEQAARAGRAEQHRERAEQLSFRFVDLDRRFGI
jgi:hypothetical protein